MDISVVTGSGTGKTILSAFDAALKAAGVYNYNLIALSSIIPPGSKITKIDQYQTPDDEYGHRLYVIKAEMRSDQTGKYLAAGLGWYQLEDGRGMFVEHEIIGETKVAVESEIKLRIKNSLKDLCSFRKVKFSDKKARSAIVVTQVKGRPTSVLALAVYKAEGWK